MNPDDNVKIVTINGKKHIMFDEFIVVPVWKLRELFLRGYAKWRRETKEKAKETKP